MVSAGHVYAADSVGIPVTIRNGDDTLMRNQIVQEGATSPHHKPLLTRPSALPSTLETHAEKNPERPLLTS